MILFPFSKKIIALIGVLCLAFEARAIEGNLSVFQDNFKLSAQCLQCLDQDFVKNHKTLQQQENDCLAQELERVYEKLKTTFNFVIFYMKNINSGDSQEDAIQKEQQERIDSLEKSHAVFLAFVQKFCEDNRKVKGVRAENIDFYKEQIDFLNLRCVHLESMVNSSDIKFEKLDEMFTAILDGILTSSSKNNQLTDQQNQTLDTFLRLFKFFERPNFDLKEQERFLKTLMDLYKKENNLIALALYNKFSPVFKARPKSE